LSGIIPMVRSDARGPSRRVEPCNGFEPGFPGLFSRCQTRFAIAYQRRDGGDRRTLLNRTATRTPFGGPPHPNPLPVGARAISHSGRSGKREDAVFFTSPLRGEVGRRPGEGAPTTTVLHHHALGGCRQEVFSQPSVSGRTSSFRFKALHRCPV
jgi:hypothetical protein